MQVKDTVWIFIHLPKTGGTTINAHLYQHCVWDKTFIHLGDWGNAYRKTTKQKSFGERTAQERSQIAVLSGHRTYYGVHRAIPNKTARYFTIVRDPADRCVSLYNFERSRGEKETDFETWYTNRYPLHYRRFPCHFLAERVMNLRLPPNHAQNLRLSCQLLDLCWHVGLTEQLDQELNYIFSAMGLPLDWKNCRVAGQADNPLGGLSYLEHDEVIQKYYELDSAMRTRIYEEHTWDVRLYEYARQLNAKQWDQIRASQQLERGGRVEHLSEVRHEQAE